MQLILLLALACRPLGFGDRCGSHLDCADTEGCLLGYCLEATCRSHDDCPFGERCQELSCVPGCVTSADCGASATCEQGVCEPAVCEDTRLDCPAATTCENGVCEAEPGICTPCIDSCDDGLFCVGGLGLEAHCLPRCRAATGCPAAFDCVPVEGLGFSVCAADCAWLDAEGWLP